jgi:murein DD-endopeptidase MepM/ murein hydrolase activator NlpD
MIVILNLTARQSRPKDSLKWRDGLPCPIICGGLAGRLLILIGFVSVLALTGAAAGAPSATGAGTPSAKAVGISVSVPGQSGASGGVVSGPPDAVGVGGSFAYPADGSIASAGSVSSSVSGAAGSTTKAIASVDVSTLSLFGGEITASAVSAHATATADPRTIAGETNGSAVTNLVVLGQAVASVPGASVAYGTWGTVSVLQEDAASFGGSGGLRGFRSNMTSLVVHLTAEHGGAPAGTSIVVGSINVSASLRAVAKAKPSRPAIRKAAKPKSKPKEKPAKKKVGSLPLRQIPFNVFPKLTAGGYVFPVYGQASYTNTFGSPRADTGWHHGEDIFAQLGAPILAVANGIVYSVGWNDIGGLRLWLQDLAGNEFYYAHLSAFSPLAVNGAQVRAGDVLGFMGNTGDAEATPYHLHFEIHPASLIYMGYEGAVAPYPYLNAWRRLQDLPLTAVAGWAPPISDSSRAPKPGAILLQSRDISNATGLEPSSLRRAMRASRPTGAADGTFSSVAAGGRGQPRAALALPGGDR